MLTLDQCFILSILRSSLITHESICNDCHDQLITSRFITRNGILLTVYQKLPDTLKRELSGKYYGSLKQAVNQDYEGKSVLKALDDAGMDCIALKGWIMREYYPVPTMRQMADLDILVRPYDYKKIESVMKKLGYESEAESSWKHDSFKKDEVHVEMHKRLTDDSDQIQSWEQGVWDRAVSVKGHIYKMTSEDYYVFHFVHLYKDFMNGSLGLRRIADTWLLQQQTVQMDVVKTYLESFGIWEFHERMVRLSRAAMGDIAIDEGSEFLLSHAFKYGIYGSEKSYKAGRIASMGESMTSGKIKSKIAAVFLPFKRMKAQYPNLKKWPILLPYYWIKRIGTILKTDMKKNRRMLNYNTISEEDYMEMKQFFEAGGV